jgi:hypothetical protein
VEGFFHEFAWYMCQEEGIVQGQCSKEKMEDEKKRKVKNT